MATYKELLAQQEELALKIEEARFTELSVAIEQVKQLVQDFGLTSKDIFGSSTKTREAKVARKGSPVPAKYKDPMSGNTWSGRGLAPKWLKGKNKEGFLI